jgi:hypothetical protein
VKQSLLNDKRGPAAGETGKTENSTCACAQKIQQNSQCPIPGYTGHPWGTELTGYSATTHCHALPRIAHYHALPLPHHALPRTTHYQKHTHYPIKADPLGLQPDSSRSRSEAARSIFPIPEAESSERWWSSVGNVRCCTLAPSCSSSS